MKLYTFTLYQLTGIQKGIQSAHATVEYGLGNVLCREAEARRLYKDWATNHKTMILLQGGTVSSMSVRETELVLRDIPFALFSEPDLGNIITAIAFILPDDSIHSEWVRNFSLTPN